MYACHIACGPFWNQMEVAHPRGSEMGKRTFVAVHTDCDCLLACNHKHLNVTTATACISAPGGYVVAVRRRKFLPLTAAEEAEFQSTMYGRGKAEKRLVPDIGLLGKLPQE